MQILTGMHEFLTLALLLPCMFSPLLILVSWLFRGLVDRIRYF